MEDDFLKNKQIEKEMTEKQKRLEDQVKFHMKQNEKLQAELTKKNQDLKENRDKHEQILKSLEEKNDEFQHLEKDCKEVIENFLNDSENFTFHVEYNKNKSTWPIDDDSLTFARLKEKMRGLTGRSSNEYVFADENDRIFLDNMKVKGVLFPFTKVNLQKNYPVVKVCDVFYEELGQNDIIKAKSDSTDVSKSSKTKNILNKVIEYFQKNYYSMLQLLVFFLFIYFYVMNTIYFRNNEEFGEIIETFNSFGLKGFSSDHLSFLRKFKGVIGKFMSFPTEQELSRGAIYDNNNIPLFCQLNKVLYSANIIQTRLKSIDCTLERFNNRTFLSNSCSPGNQMEYTSWKGDNFVKDQFSQEIIGLNGAYDNSGFNMSINIHTPKDFYKAINELESEKWIDDKTRSIIFIMNYYNINHDLFLSVRMLFERVVPELKLTQIDFGIMDLTPYTNFYFIISGLFSIVCLILLIWKLKVNNPNAERWVKKKESNWEKFKEFIKYSFYTYFKENYRKPEFFEYFTFFTFLFYFIIAFYQINYYQSLQNLEIISTGYTDFSEYRFLFNMVANLNCAVILLLFVCSLNYISEFSDDLKNIRKSIIDYSIHVVQSNLILLLIFILFSFFSTYFLAGDTSLPYYKNFIFVFLKLIQAFHRGSIDNVDDDISLDRYKKTNTLYSAFSSAKFDELLLSSQGSFDKIIYMVSLIGFFLSSLMFYLVVNLLIKVANTALYLTKYRENSILNEKKD